MLKIVLEPLFLGSRYRLSESSGRAVRALRLQILSYRSSPEFYGTDTHVLLHCIYYCLGSSLIQSQLLYKFIVRIAGKSPRIHEHPIRPDYPLINKRHDRQVPLKHPLAMNGCLGVCVRKGEPARCVDTYLSQRSILLIRERLYRSNKGVHAVRKPPGVR